MSRVFGPLTRYRLYECRDDNRNWELDLQSPCTGVWDYVCSHYATVQRQFGFDFMRGDMAHVQVRKDGVPRTWSDRERKSYDLLSAVKSHIRCACGTRHFAYLAESFLHGRGSFGYSEEIDHLEACQADTALGDLQSVPVGSPGFLQRLRLYDGWREARSCTPAITVMTSDKDDPRFDMYYQAGNPVRLFISFFVTDMPGYMGSGFESRDLHVTPAPNEHYTKLYVFHRDRGPGATRGPYVWGTNRDLFRDVTRLRLYAEEVLPRIRHQGTAWLIHPDPTAQNPVLAWTQRAGQDGMPRYLFLANTDTARPVGGFAVPAIPGLDPRHPVLLDFSTANEVAGDDRALEFNGFHYRVECLAPGEGRAYRLAEIRHEECGSM